MNNKANVKLESSFDSIKKHITETINKLNLDNITVNDIYLIDNFCSDGTEMNPDIEICIYGGKNSRGNWAEYLDQMKQIVSALNGWVYNLAIDHLDDVWELKVRIQVS